MAAFKAAKWRGKALARLLAGVTLPLPGGSGITIPDVFVKAASAVTASAPFGPYDTESVAQTIYYNHTGSSSLYFNRDNGTDAAGTPNVAIRFQLLGLGSYSLSKISNGVVTNPNVINNKAWATGAIPAGTACSVTRNVDQSFTHIRLDTGAVTTITAAQVAGTAGGSIFTGTWVSAIGNLQQLSAQGNAVPLTVNSVSLGTGYRPTVDINYTGTGLTGYNIQLQTVGGQAIGAKLPAVITILAPGHLTLTAATTFGPDQFSADVVTRVYEVVNGVETGVFKDAKSSMPGRPATFGSNLAPFSRFGPLRTYADLYRVGVTKDTTTQGYPVVPNGTTGKTDANGWPLTVGVQRSIGAPDTSGQVCVITWDGTGNSINRVANSEGDMSISGVTTLGPNSASYVPTFTRSGIGGNSIAEVRFNIGSVPPTNIKIYPQGEDRTAYWADSYLAYANKSNGVFSGAMRVMDTRAINGNGTVDMTWAMRTLPDAVNRGIDGEPIERVIELANFCNRDLWLPVPAYATDDYITQLAIAIDTGANLSQGKPWSNGLAPGLKWYFERGNEVWNVQFANYQYDRTRYCARTGETRLSDGGGGTEQSYKEHAFQYDRLVSGVMAAIPNYANRVVRVYATQRSLTMYNIALQAGLVGKIDALAVAPYFDVSAFAAQINALPAKTPEAIEPFMLQTIDSVMSSMAPYPVAARANGHRFLTYEAGMDWANNNDPDAQGENNPISPNYKGKPMYLTGEEVFAFRTSPSFYRATYRIFNTWKSQYGDEISQYYDIGGTPGGRYQWGLKPYQGSPAPDYGVLALQDVIAGLPPRY